MREAKPKAKSSIKAKPSSQLEFNKVLDRLTQLENLVKDTSISPKQQTSRDSHRPSRDRCLIVVNAPESSKSTPAERILDDEAFLIRMISLLFDEGEPGINVVSAFRIGRKQEDSTKSRPLKIVCQNEDECRRILRRTSRLKGESFYVLRDLSPEDRIKMKSAVGELRTRRANGETDLHIVDFRVVPKTPRTRWRPILVLPGQ
ncbi:unnamed protein product [Dicrocoelium dendriticum]|nr:unnamed protein product [Dicrocoelium dendriticum]